MNRSMERSGVKPVLGGTHIANDWLREMFVGGSSIVASVACDGTILSAVSGAVSQPLEQIEGRSFSRLFSPESHEEVELALKRAMESRNPVQIDAACLRADGTRGWHLLVIAPIVQGTDIVSLGIYSTDITNRKREEERLRRSEAMMVDTQGVAHLGVWDWDITQPHAVWSPELYRIYGLTPETYVPTYEGYLTKVHPDDRQRVIDATNEAFHNLKAYSHDERIYRADGSLCYLHTWAFPVLDDGGKLARLMGVCQDITDRKMAENAVAEQAAALTRTNAELVKLGRIQAIHSGINRLIVRVRSQQELLQEACRILAEEGGLVLAWIGKVEEAVLRPVAFHGQGDHLEQLHIDLRDNYPEGEPPLVQALRENKPVVCNDLSKISAMAAFCAMPLNTDCSALLTLPLLVGAKVVGSLSLIAAEAGYFDESKLKLFSEIASELSYAMESIAREEHIGYLGYFDSLTGLANRRLFGERLTQFTQRAQESKHKLAVLLLDLERFKAVNDVLGEAGGDELLKRVAERLALFAGGATYIARVGGDRFAAIIPELKGADHLMRLLHEQVWDRLGQPFMVGEQNVHIGAKLGIAMFPDDGGDAESLMRNAEAALKTAKAGSERYIFYTQQMSATIAAKMRLENQMRKALEQNEFVLHYQPKVDLTSGAICGAEALIRWNSPELGLVAPGIFIPLLEETGMILDVGRWVLQQAVTDHRSWLDAGLPVGCLAVNASALQLRQPDFVEMVRHMIAAIAANQPGIELEITESVLMTDIERHAEKLKNLRAMGVQLSIDDFGTGYSSLAYLAKLPISTLKIDRSFIIGMTEGPDSMSIVAAIISMAHSLNLRVIAEGVDSREQLQILRNLNCDEMQGYLFSKAVPATELVKMLRDDRRLAL